MLQAANDSANNGKRNNVGIVAQTPKGNSVMQSNDMQHAVMQERYSAILNKNLEDTSNLAKTLRNTKVHIYDKLRNSY